MDANSFLKCIALFAFLTALPAFASASPPGGGGHSSGGGGGHSAGGGQAVGGRGQVVGGRSQVVGGRGGHSVGGRSSAGTHANASTVRRGTVPVANNRSFRNDPSRRGDWKHGHGTAWHRDDNDNDKNHHHRHNRVSLGFFPYWYPSGGYYSYGYPDYSYDYYDDYYPDNGYYSGQSDSAGIQVLVQEALARRGYYAGQVDGVIGPETRSAIREFQRDNGLPETGRITPKLLRALGNGND
jgi:hypothetical protein